MAQSDSTAAGNGSGGAIFLVIALAALAVVWVGAQLAALLSGNHLGAGLSPTFHALVHLPANPDNPAAAWGPPWDASAWSRDIGLASGAPEAEVPRRTAGAGSEPRAVRAAHPGPATADGGPRP